MNTRKLVVFDFETDGKNPHECNPVQVAATVIDPFKMELIPGAEFNMMMKPPGIETTEYFTPERLETINWHAKIKNCSGDDIVNTWKEAPNQKFVWNQFSTFVNNYNYKGTMWTAPIACGANIREFDLPIAHRLNQQYNIKTMFWPRDKVDLLDLSFYWFESLNDGPQNYKVDELRDFFGMSKENAHDALQDVRDCAILIIKFMNLHRRTAKRVIWNGQKVQV